MIYTLVEVEDIILWLERYRTKWLRILSVPPNDKIRNHLVANPIYLKYTQKQRVSSTVKILCQLYTTLDQQRTIE